MHVKLLKAPLSYTLGSGHQDPRQPTVIAGSKDQFEAVCAVSQSAQKSKHFVLSHSPMDRPSRKQMLEDVALFLKHISRGRDEADLAYVAVLHLEASGDQIGDPVQARQASHRFAIHTHIAEVDLATGKRLQLFYGPAHRRPLTAWQTKLNQARGYQDPTAQENRRAQKPVYDQVKLNDRVLAAAAATLVALQGRSQLEPQSWAKILRPHIDDARIDCCEKNGTLWARLTPPGLASANVLTLFPDGTLKIRAAKSRCRSPQAAKSDGDSRVQAVALPGEIGTSAKSNLSGKKWHFELARRVAEMTRDREAAEVLEPFDAARLRRRVMPPNLDPSAGGSTRAP